MTAYEHVARLHNDLGLAPPVDPHVKPFHDRPFRVLHGERFAAALVDSITDPTVRRLPWTGAVDQFVDSTDVLAHPPAPVARRRPLPFVNRRAGPALRSA